MLTQKVVIDPIMRQGDIYLCVLALQKYLIMFPDRVDERRQTFYNKLRTHKMKVRERANSIHVSLEFIESPTKYGRGITIC